MALNKVIIIGRLVRDPDVRYTQIQSGEQMAIARYSLAVDRVGKDKGTDYPNCVAFGKQGEFAEKYLKKGMKIAIEGRLQTGSYEKDGVKHYTTDIVVERHEFCESKGESQESAPQPAPEVAEGFMNIPEGASDDLPFKK
jgi:single-strand DNA-binding protein